jgi:hypothetical protein
MGVDSTANTKGATMKTVYFTKQFLSGALKGISINTQVSFATQEAADSFARGYSDRSATHKDVLTQTRFRVTDVAFQKYARD